jgi:hypothetical protein
MEEVLIFFFFFALLENILIYWELYSLILSLDLIQIEIVYTIYFF